MRNISRATAPLGDYWINALCINQTDSMEAYAQVGKMREIHPLARHTIVWPSANNGDEVHSLFQLLNLFRLDAVENGEEITTRSTT